MTDNTETTAAEKARLEAVIAEHRDLVAENPDNLYPEYAEALMALAALLAEEEQVAAALANARQGVEQFRQLDAKDPKAYAVHLASALNNLANRQTEADQDEDARKTCDEAIRVATECLEADNSTQSRFVLVSSLMNQAGRSWRLGQPARALSDMSNAVEAFRVGATEMGDFLGVMVDALHKNALALGEANFWEEAVALRRMCARVFPDSVVVPPAVNQLLALTLEQASYARGKEGHHREAVPMAQEAVELARGLAAQGGAYNLFLAQSLSNLAARLVEAGGAGPALESALEAIKIYEDASQTNAAEVVIPLANTLDTFAEALDALDHPEQAQQVRSQRDELLAMVQGGEE